MPRRPTAPRPTRGQSRNCRWLNGLCHIFPPVTFGRADDAGVRVLLSELLTPEQIRVPMSAVDKRGAIQELVRLLAERSGGDYRDLLAAVEEREGVLSTGIGHGVAVPHGRSAALGRLFLICGSSPHPIPFDALDGEPVRLFFLLVGPEAVAGQHVRALSRIARIVRRDAVCDRLAQADTPGDFLQALLEAEGP